jgi:hypothetical protein
MFRMLLKTVADSKGRSFNRYFVLTPLKSHSGGSSDIERSFDIGECMKLGDAGVSKSIDCVDSKSR